MPEELLVRHCSPTLAGMKTGNIFTCSFDDKKKMRDDLRKLNVILSKKGLRLLPLRFRNKRALIYIYRPSKLSEDLHNTIACHLLKERGYESNKPELCVIRLIERISQYDEFPHEIGLFLGYPPEDICGFIENKAGGCKCVGCWKVYGDEKVAQKLFAKYKKCTEIYCRQFANGRSIEQLTVAV